MTEREKAAGTGAGAPADCAWDEDADLLSDGASDDAVEVDSEAGGARLRAEHVLPLDSAGMRLDQALAALLPDHSRSRLQQWLRRGEILLDAAQAAPRRRVLGGERVSIDALATMAEHWVAEPVPICVHYADSAIIVIDKPVGLVVHPGAGNPRGTLVNGLLHRYPELAGVPRAGIVHRLDKDTSGLLVVARTEAAHGHLVRQLADRSMGRAYLGLVEGVPTAGFRVDAPIGRDPRQRLRMAVVDNGRAAVTHVRVAERFRVHALLACRLETGRTHQIRVHLRSCNLPLVGDRLYGARQRIPKGASPALVSALQSIDRQALHAAELELTHPGHGDRVRFDSPLPTDLAELLELLREDSAADEVARS